MSTSVSGYTWGSAALSDSHFQVLDGSGNATMSVPISEVSQTSANGKELVMEFHQDNTRDREDEYITELRFHVPDENVMNELRDGIVSKTGGSGAGEALCRIPDVPLVLPRGHHDLEFLPGNFRLRGKTFSYTVKYKNVSRVFLLPKPDDVHVAFVLGLDQPVRQGNTAYPYLVFQFDKDRDVDVQIALDEGLTKSGTVKAHEEAKLYDLLARLFKVLSEKAAVMPAIDDFKSGSGHGCVRCSHRAMEGHLYCMKKGFLFVNKPVVFIKYDEVASVEFSRTEQGATTRYFDLKVYRKNENSPHDFQQIERNEYQPLIDFLQTVGIKIRNLQPAKGKDTSREKEADKGILDGDLPSEDEEDDEDFESGSDQDSHDSDDSDDSEDESEVSEDESNKKRRK